VWVHLQLPSAAPEVNESCRRKTAALPSTFLAEVAAVTGGMGMEIVGVVAEGEACLHREVARGVDECDD